MKEIEFKKGDKQMNKVLAFETHGEGYAINQILDKAITVEELKNFLEDFPDDTIVVFKNDYGYTYGNFNLSYNEDGATVYREEYDEDYGEMDYIPD